MKRFLDRLTTAGRRRVVLRSPLAILPRLAFAAVVPLVLLTTVSTSRAVEPQTLSGHVPALARRLAPIGRPPADQKLNLAVSLPIRNRAELEELVGQVTDPSSPQYRNYLKPQQFAERFGPLEADYEAVVAFLESQGLRVTRRFSNRTMINVEGSVADIEKAFSLSMQLYKHPTESRNFYAPDREPSVSLRVPLAHIGGLDNSAPPRPANLRRKVSPPVVKTPVGVAPAGGGGVGVHPAGGSGPQGNYMGNDFRAAYIPGTPLTGDGQTVALLEFDGFFTSDIAAYEAMAGVPPVPLQVILMDGFNGTPGSGNSEVALDIEMCICMAPGLSRIVLYEGQIPESVLNQIASDDLANQISASWTWIGGPSLVFDQIFMQMAAQGQSYFNACGDFDAWPTGALDDPSLFGTPADSPYITVVGGTTLSTTGPGGAFVSETVWQWGASPGDPFGGAGGSGGISSFYTIPSWQQGVNMSTNGGSTSYRNVPDVALTADNIVVVADDGQIEPGTGGTSAATPLWAAFTALVNQQAAANGQQPIGFANPPLYAIAKNPGLYRNAFHDVVTGNNTNAVSTNLFFAYPGFDLCTGWGSPNTPLINMLAPPTGLVPKISYVGSSLLGGNGNGVIDPNECNSLLIVLTNSGKVNATGVSARLTTSTPGVIVAQGTSAYPAMLTNSAATNLLAFRISTAPTFICGSSVQFNLVVTSDQSYTSTRFNFRMASGTAGQPWRFDSAVPVAIPSPGGASSSLVVTNFPSAVLKVAASVFLPNNYDSGLTVELIGPDGTTNTLASGDGAGGQSFGVACSPDSARTTFDDAAAQQIGAGVAPFAGSYQPQQALTAFVGKSGTGVNGTWKLRVFDSYGANASINCWSLFLTPATCTDGGGECPGSDMGVAITASPDPVIVNNGFTYNLIVTNTGPSGVQSAVVTLLLPTGVSFVSATPSQGGWSLAGGVVTFNLGAMRALATATISVAVQAVAEGTFVTSAVVSSEQQDPNSLNNTATVVSHIQAPTSDLGVTVTANTATVLVGQTFTYTVTAVNNGPGLATGVFITNTLPAGVAVISSSVSQGAIVSSGNALVCNLGSLTNAQTATASITVEATSAGTLVETSKIIGAQYDPVSRNNQATVSVASGPDADLAVGVTVNPNPAVLNSNLTYYVTVTNLGPSVAAGVVLNFALDPSLVLISSNLSQGTLAVSGKNVTANIGSMPNGGVVQAILRTSPTVPGTISSSASVIGSEPDENSGNNRLTVAAQVSYPFVNIVPAGATLTSESFSPATGIIYNGETVGMSLRLRNAGNVANTNLVALLLATNGVTPTAPNNPQVFGVLAPSGLPVARTFSFTANGASGSTITAVLQLRDAGVVITNVGFSFTLPTVLTFSNSNPITITDNSSATPYPSTIVVTGVSNTLAKVTASFQNFNHSDPQDVDALLVAPSGATTVLMSHVGDSISSGANVVFDDTASGPLPMWGSVLSGTYQPTAYTGNGVFRSQVTSSAVPFPIPAPAGPYPTLLSSLNGGNPNGTWSLFLEDDRLGDAGGIANGWSLSFTLAAPVNPLADLSLTVAAPASVTIPAPLSYTYTVSNSGPSIATYVVFTNVLPAGVTYLAGSSSQGTVGLLNNSVVGNLGTLAVGATATVTFSVTPSPSAAGWLTNSASVAATQIDLNPANNTTPAVVYLGLPAADLAVSDSIAPATVVAGFPITNTIVVTNAGPGLALNSTLTSLLPSNAIFVTANTTNATWTTNGGIFVATFGNLPTNAPVTVSLVLIPTTTNTSGVGPNPPLVSVVSVSTASLDGNLSNNSVTNVLAVNNPAPALLPAGAWLVAEHGIVNGALNVGDTVTVLLAITNGGTLDTSSNLTATLLPTTGIGPAGTASQVFGTIPHGGGAVSEPFTFTVTGPTSPGLAVATLALVDIQSLAGGGTVTNNYVVSYNFPLPTTVAQANTNYIVLPTYGPATPYPSVVNISGLTGVVSKVTVTLRGFYHTFPSDVEAVLVDPAGQAVSLMANAGYTYSVNGLQLSLDDAAAGPLPEYAPLTSGTFEPTAYGQLTSLPTPAPAAPYASTLSALNGSAPNGAWSLYFFDKRGDSGGLTGGWTLNLTTASPLPIAAPGLQLQAGSSGTYQLVLYGTPGVTYVLESSTDLVNWTVISTNKATAVPVVLSVNPQSAAFQFYRAVAQP